ncbi:hypothetical protein DdX_13715 [Ditylenchus destructor]|uniref:Uncharacterized protein n=1 Tax=Ditylenchus destructor TaxID=166010 RepID=A0AAD4MY41_9BILA|nr:hypothetical protein DdX_13715 [Ditylenchus destructor]
MEEPSTSKAEHLDESQFVDEKIKIASEVAATVMIAISVLLSIALCYSVHRVLIVTSVWPIVAYGCVFYVHSCNFDARRGNPLAGAYVFSAFFILLAVGFIVIFIYNCFRKSFSISPPFSVLLALLCLVFIVYQWYCIGLFYKDGQDHYRLWKARHCLNKNFDPEGRKFRKDIPEARTPSDQENAVKIVDSPTKTCQNCNISMHNAEPMSSDNSITSSKSSDMDPEKGNCLECPD